MNRLFYIFIFCLLLNSLSAQPELIFDGFRGSFQSLSVPQLDFNGQYVFILRDQSKRDIWMTDGTTTDNLTIWLSGENFGYYAVTDNYLYFVEGYDNSYQSIWKNNGTYTGSEKVWENINSISLHGFQDKLFVFTHSTIDSIPEIWVMDENDNKIKLLDSTGGSYDAANFNNHLYFFASNHGLIKSDGTVSGTSILKSVDFTFRGSNFMENAIFNNELYFIVSGEYGDNEIWKTDGTEVGTVFIGNCDSNEQYPYFKFVATSNNLFVYDTKQIYCINNQGFNLILDTEWDNTNVEIYNGKTVNDKAIFAINDFGKYGTELWTSDGTIEGTTILKDIFKYAADGVSNSLFCFEVIGNYLYFIGNSGQYGQEIWRTDGTASGTHLVYDLKQNAASSFFENMFAVGNDLYLFRKELRPNLTETKSIWKFDVENFTPPQYDFDDEIDLHSIHSGYDNRLTDFQQDSDKSSYFGIMNNNHIKNDITFFNQDTIVPINGYSNYYTSTIAKLSYDNKFEWATTFYSATNILDDREFIIGTNHSNEVFVAGHYKDYLTVNNQDYTVNQRGFYISKLDEEGNVEWLVSGKGFATLQLSELLITQNGEILLVGIFSDIHINGNSYSGSKSPFVLKLDNNGEFLSFTQVRETSNNLTYNSVYADITSNDEIIIAEVNNRKTIHLHKVNNNNQVVWSKKYNDINIDEEDYENRAYINDLAISPTDEIYVLGSYKNKLNFLRDNAIYRTESRDSKTNGFLARFNNFGELIQLSADETTNSEYNAITFNKENGDYFLNQEIIHDTPLFYNNWEDYPTVYQSIIQKFDSNGQLLNEKKLHRYFDIKALEIGHNNHLKYVGTYHNQLDTFAHCIPHSNVVSGVIFLLDLPIDNTFNSYEPIYAETDITISPNPATTACLIHIHDKSWQTYQLNIYSSNGQLVKSINKNNELNAQSIRIADLPTGLLIFEFKNDDKRLTKKIIKY